MVVTIVKSEAEFKSYLKDAGHKLVVVDFHATWCGPCKMIAPKIEEMSAEFSNVVFLKVDVDEVSEVSEEYEISAMPTFLYFIDGAKIETVVGASVEKILENIKKHS